MPGKYYDELEVTGQAKIIKTGIKALCLLLTFWIVIVVSAQESETLAERLQNSADFPKLVRWFDVNPENDFEQIVFGRNHLALTVVESDEVLILLLNELNNTVAHRFLHGTDITDMTFNSNGSRLVTAGLDGVIKSWDMSSFILQSEINTENFPIHFIDLVADQYMFTNGASTELILWDTYFAEEDFRLKFEASPIDTAVDSDRKQRAVLLDNGTLVVLNERLLDHAPLYDFETLCQNSHPQAVTFASNPEFIYTGCENGDLVIHHLENTLEPVQLSGLNYLPFVKSENHSNVLPVHENDRIHFVSITTSEFETISVLNDRLPYDALARMSHDGSLALMQLEPMPDLETTELGATGFDLIDTSTGEAIFFFGQTTHAQFSPDDRYIFTTTLDGDVLLFQLF